MFLKSFYLLLFWAFFSGVAYSFTSGSFVSLVYDNLKFLKKENMFNKIQSNYRSIMEISVFSSGFLSGFIANISYYLAIELSAVTSFVSIILIALIKEYPFKKPTHKNNFANLLRTTTNIFKKNKIMIELATIFVYMNTLLSLIMAYSQAYIYFIIPSLPIVTMSLSFVYLSNVIGYKLSLNFKNRMYPYAPFILTFIIFFLGIYPNPLSIGLMIIIQIINASFIIKWQSDFHKIVPSENRASAISFVYLISTLVLFITYAIFGFSIDNSGLFKTIIYASISGFVFLMFYSLITYYSKKNIKN